MLNFGSFEIAVDMFAYDLPEILMFTDLMLFQIC